VTLNARPSPAKCLQEGIARNVCLVEHSRQRASLEFSMVGNDANRRVSPHHYVAPAAADDFEAK